MKKLLLLFTVVCAMNLISCGKGNSNEKGSKQSVDQSKEEEEEVELINYENSRMGFTILAPKKAKIILDNDFSFITSQALSDGFLDEVSISVSPTYTDFDSLEDFKKDLETFAMNEIIRTEEVDNGYLGVEKLNKFVRIYFEIENFRAEVTTPENFQSLAEKIAKSIKSAK